MKKKVVIICAVIFALLAAVVFLKRDAIFQRGNPIPYLTAAVQLSETNPYVAVDETNCIYISNICFQMETIIISSVQKSTGADLQSGHYLQHKLKRNCGATQS